MGDMYNYEVVTFVNDEIFTTEVNNVMNIDLQDGVYVFFNELVILFSCPINSTVYVNKLD